MAGDDSPGSSPQAIARGTCDDTKADKNVDVSKDGNATADGAPGQEEVVGPGAECLPDQHRPNEDGHRDNGVSEPDQKAEGATFPVLKQTDVGQVAADQAGRSSGDAAHKLPEVQDSQHDDESEPRDNAEHSVSECKTQHDVTEGESEVADGSADGNQVGDAFRADASEPDTHGLTNEDVDSGIKRGRLGPAEERSTDPEMPTALSGVAPEAGSSGGNDKDQGAGAGARELSAGDGTEDGEAAQPQRKEETADKRKADASDDNAKDACQAEITRDTGEDSGFGDRASAEPADKVETANTLDEGTPRSGRKSRRGTRGAGRPGKPRDAASPAEAEASAEDDRSAERRTGGGEGDTAEGRRTRGGGVGGADSLSTANDRNVEAAFEGTAAVQSMQRSSREPRKRDAPAVAPAPVPEVGASRAGKRRKGKRGAAAEVAEGGGDVDSVSARESSAAEAESSSEVAEATNAGETADAGETAEADTAELVHDAAQGEADGGEPSEEACAQDSEATVEGGALGCKKTARGKKGKRKGRGSLESVDDKDGDVEEVDGAADKDGESIREVSASREPVEGAGDTEQGTQGTADASQISDPDATGEAKEEQTDGGAKMDVDDDGAQPVASDMKGSTEDAMEVDSAPCREAKDDQSDEAGTRPQEVKVENEALDQAHGSGKKGDDDKWDAEPAKEVQGASEGDTDLESGLSVTKAESQDTQVSSQTEALQQEEGKSVQTTAASRTAAADELPGVGPTATEAAVEASHKAEAGSGSGLETGGKGDEAKGENAATEAEAEAEGDSHTESAVKQEAEADRQTVGGQTAAIANPTGAEKPVVLKVGPVVVRSLGTVSPLPGYHTRRALFPIGFSSERPYPSYVTPGKQAIYACQVLEGERGPRFRVTPTDDPGNAITAETPTAAWRIAEQRVQAAPGAPGATRPAPSARMCGAGYFGLASPSVIRLLLSQQSPAIEACGGFSAARKANLFTSAAEEDSLPASAADQTGQTPVHKATAGQGSPSTSAAGAAAAGKEGEWLGEMQRELGGLKHRTRQTIQPLSHSQLQPEGWNAAEVDAYFNGLNEHQMQAAGLAAAIGSKSAQQVLQYAEYVCDVMDRRVRASREEQLQKQAVALATAQQSVAGSAHDAGAAALQAAVAAAAIAPKEGTPLKQMLRDPALHPTLVHVLTHLWHTERLWRHALQQGLVLFNETHALSDRMLEKLAVVRTKLKGVGGGGGGGGGGTALQKRLEEDLRRSRVESAERHKKLTDAEKLVCPAAPCCAPPLCGARDGAGGWSASRTLPFALAAG